MLNLSYRQLARCTILARHAGVNRLHATQCHAMSPARNKRAAPEAAICCACGVLRTKSCRMPSSWREAPSLSSSRHRQHMKFTRNLLPTPIQERGKTLLHRIGMTFTPAKIQTHPISPWFCGELLVTPGFPPAAPPQAKLYAITSSACRSDNIHPNATSLGASILPLDVL